MRAWLAGPARVWRAIPWAVRARVVSLVLALGTGTVLGVALWLVPDPVGHGTHLQLGLNECSFLQLTGRPCPMCGATTTFTLWAHGRPLAGIANQPFASMLFLMTAVTFGISVAEVVWPTRRWERIVEALLPWELTLAGAFLAVMGGSWIYKIWLMA